MDDWLELRDKTIPLLCEEDLLTLFKNEDVLIEDDDYTSWCKKVVYIRPAENYNHNPDWNYLSKIALNHRNEFEQITTVRDIQFNLETKQVECFGEVPRISLTKTAVLTILSEYNAACENFRKYYKNRKNAEIKRICGKYTV